MTNGLCIEMIKVKPTPGSKARLMEIRDSMVDHYAKYDGFVSVTLIAAEDGEHWFDVWAWETKAHAEAAMGDKTPVFEEWDSLAKLDSFDWAEVISVRD